MIREAEVEERLVVSMRDYVAGVSLDRQILQRANQRYRRRKTVRRGAYGAGTMAVVAILAVAVITWMHPGSPPAAKLPGDTAQARLIGAITASQSTSFLVAISVLSKRADRDNEMSMALTGAYDPATDSGFLRSADMEERLVTGVRYVIRKGLVREVARFKSEFLLFEWPAGNGFLGSSADPTSLLEAMRENGAKITEIDGAFHFEMTFPRDDPRGRTDVAVSGGVTVGAGNRVAQVTYKSIVSGFTNAELMTVMEFFGYGTPVKVEKP